MTPSGFSAETPPSRSTVLMANTAATMMARHAATPRMLACAPRVKTTMSENANMAAKTSSIGRSFGDSSMVQRLPQILPRARETSSSYREFGTSRRRTAVKQPSAPAACTYPSTASSST